MDGDLEDLGGLERWAADARARDAADARVRERWLRSQAEEEASLAGVLLALAERRSAVVVTTTTGRRLHGVVRGVGIDFAAVESGGGSLTLVTLAAVAEVRAVDERARSSAAAASIEGALGVGLADVLAQAAGQRPRISVQAGATAVVGDLRAVGRDVLTVRADGAAGVVYVGLPSISEISFLASG